MQNNDKAKPRQSALRQSIKLDDLLPRQNVKGGTAKAQVVFGSLENRPRRPASGI